MVSTSYSMNTRVAGDGTSLVRDLSRPGPSLLSEPGMAMGPEYLAHLVMLYINKKAYKPSVEKIKDKYYEMFRGNKAARAWKWRKTKNDFRTAKQAQAVPSKVGPSAK